jgi:hypothetical protein
VLDLFGAAAGQNLYTDQVGGYRPPHSLHARVGLVQVGFFRFRFFLSFSVSFFFSIFF